MLCGFAVVLKNSLLRARRPVVIFQPDIDIHVLTACPLAPFSKLSMAECTTSLSSHHLQLDNAFIGVHYLL